MYYYQTLIKTTNYIQDIANILKLHISKKQKQIAKYSMIESIEIQQFTTCTQYYASFKILCGCIYCALKKNSYGEVVLNE